MFTGMFGPAHVLFAVIVFAVLWFAVRLIRKVVK